MFLVRFLDSSNLTIYCHQLVLDEELILLQTRDGNKSYYRDCKIQITTHPSNKS